MIIKNLIKKIYYNKLIFGLILLSFFFVISDYSYLGFFADDIGTIFFLSQDINFNELVKYSINWDAARDLHLIWQKILIEISEPEIRKKIHLYQFLLYFINSILVFYILIILKVEKHISSIALLLFIFTSTYSEVALWTHAFSMVLFSVTFFLLFLIINLKLIKINNIKKILVYEALSIIFLLLNLFTYEQSIATCCGIILLRQIIKIKFYKIKIKNCLLILILYFFIFFLFSLYKLVESGFFNSVSNLYYTGSNIVEFKQIYLNIIHGYGVIVKDYISFDFNFYFENVNEKKFFYFGFIIFLYFIFEKKIKKINYSKNSDILKIIAVCFVFYTISFIPLYLHYISYRHFYIPSIFLTVGFAFALQNLFLFFKKKKFLKNIISLFVCLIIFNCLINFEKSKKQYIENFDLKKKFYSEISNLSFNKDFELIGFPDLYKETTFFAHEQIESLKVHLNDKSLPNIYKDLKKNKKDTLKIHFDKIHHNKIIFTIGDIN